MTDENGVTITHSEALNANSILFSLADEPPIVQTKSDLQIELLRLQIQAAKREMYQRELTITQLENSLNLSEDEKKKILDRCNVFL